MADATASRLRTHEDHQIPTTPGSPDKDQSARAPKPLSDTEAVDVKGGAVNASAVSPPHSPILKPINPRSIIPCF